MTDADLDAVKAIVRECGFALTGKPPQAQGAALADLLATWLAGHVVQGDPKRSAALREEVLAFHIKAVRKLVPVNAERIHGIPSAKTTYRT